MKTKIYALVTTLLILNCYTAIYAQVNPTMQIIEFPAKTVCSNESVSLDAGSCFTTFLWNDANGTTSQHLVVAVSGIYLVTVTNSDGFSYIEKFVVTINPIPTSIVSGGGTICSSQTTDIAINLTGVAPWNFTYVNGTQTNTITTSTTPYIIPASHAGNYFVTDVTDANCNGTAFGNAPVIVNPVPTATVSGGANVCKGNSTAVSIALNGTAPWTLTYTDGSILKTINNITTSPYVITTTSSGTYTVTALNDANCIGVSNGDAIVTVNELPLVNLGNDIEICTGNTSLLNAGSGTYTYLWTTGETTQTINANIGNYTVTVTDANGCAGSDAIKIIKSNYCTTIANPVCDKVCNDLQIEAAANPISRALKYRFRFYDVASLNASIFDAEIVSNVHYFKFKDVTTMSVLKYGHTYKWTVEVEYLSAEGNVWGPPSNKSCSLTFDPKTTPAWCNTSVVNLNSFITVNPVFGSVKYLVEFYDSNNPATIVGSYTTPSKLNNHEFNLSLVPNLLYNHTYNWRVSVIYTDGANQVIGTPSATCPITIAKPKTVLECGKTFSSLTSSYSSWNPIHGCKYLIKFYEPADLITPVLQKTQTMWEINNFGNLTDDIIPTIKLLNNHSYVWTVTVLYPSGTGTYLPGEESVKSCSIKFGIQSAKFNNPFNSTGTINIFPNPAGEQIEVSANVTEFANQNVSLSISNPSGQVIITDLINVDETGSLSKSIALGNLKPGIYLLELQSNGNTIKQRFIKE